MFEISGYRITVLVADYFRLDGGAMFGSVPKNLWEKKIPGDSENCIPLACRVLVLEGHGRKILVDVGMGRKWDEKQKKIFAVNEKQSLAPLEQRITGVTDILLTHLHFDHAGGITKRNSDGKVELSFPNATIYLQKKNWLHAQDPGPREKASYLRDIVQPLQSNVSKLVLLEGASEVFPNVHVWPTNGHTHGLQCVRIGDGKKSAESRIVFPADLIPTSSHVDIPWVMGYDLCAETTMREKKEFLSQAVHDNSIVVFEHDVSTCAARIGQDERGRYVIAETLDFPEAGILV